MVSLMMGASFIVSSTWASSSWLNFTTKGISSWESSTHKARIWAQSQPHSEMSEASWWTQLGLTPEPSRFAGWTATHSGFSRARQLRCAFLSWHQLP